MRAICYTCPGYGMYKISKPTIQKPDDVLIRTAYAGICGSDVHIIQGDMDDFIGAKPGVPNIIGHEASGIIEALGREATTKGLKVGDKVVHYYNWHCGKCFYCRNGQEQFCQNILLHSEAMADYIVQNEQQVFKLPDDADLKEAALIEPVSVVLRGIDLCNIRHGTKVAISGGGGIGMLFLQLARMSGAVKLTVVEPVAEKRAEALALGADYVIDPFNEDVLFAAMHITDQMGFDVVIEASGIVDTIQTSYDILGRGGILELFACYPKNAKYSLELDSFWTKEARIIGVFQSPYLFPRSIEVYRRLNLQPFLKYIYKPEDCKEAFKVRMSGIPPKVLFDFT